MITDSGSRTKFESGAVRDIDSEKGRCDLIPLEAAAMCVGNPLYASILTSIDNYVKFGNPQSLVDAVQKFCKDIISEDIYTTLLEVSIHYKEGAEKYGEWNWQKGIPLHSYINSGVRHLLKHARGDKDERHDRAFVWNMLSAIWTQLNKPEYIDLPFKTHANE